MEESSMILSIDNFKKRIEGDVKFTILDVNEDIIGKSSAMPDGYEVLKIKYELKQQQHTEILTSIVFVSNTPHSQFSRLVMALIDVGLNNIDHTLLINKSGSAKVYYNEKNYPVVDYWTFFHSYEDTLDTLNNYKNSNYNTSMNNTFYEGD